jgi:peptidoglycan/xylan/chitin deacetylase (PgdA/CDA1 family)
VSRIINYKNIYKVIYCKRSYAYFHIYNRSNIQNKGSETGRGNKISCFGFLRLLGAGAIDYFVYRAGFANNLFGNARSFLVLALVVSLISAGLVNVNTTIGVDAFAKKNSKESCDRVDGSVGGTRDKGGDIGTDNSLQQVWEPPTTNEGQQGILPTPLPFETPTNNSKFVIINFDDSHVSEFTCAKPILDKYGFKATFFEVCNWIESGHHDNDISTTWEHIAALQQDGMDIEAHTMTHPNLISMKKKLSQADLDYEIGQSKQCLENHGINATIFAYPGGRGADNPTVVNTVAKYYNLARTDTKESALTFLHCDGGNGNDKQQQQQTDCRTYFSNGTLTPSNRYSINSWAHKHVVRECIHQEQRTQQEECPPCPPHDRTCKIIRHEYNNTQMFEKFVTAVNSQYSYNKDGIVRAIPIIIYHTIVTYPDLSYSNRHVDTTLNLFDAEMKYLHDNGFKVITMSDLGYDENSKSLYIKGT